MKVLDLRCRDGIDGHAFEGWFGSEDDFRDQLQRGLVACPVCGDTHIAKMLSAPRLNLSVARQATESRTGDAPVRQAAPSPDIAKLQAAWWKAAREAARTAEDVGPRFAEEARRIHHGDAEERGIRGQATGSEVRQLVEEGVGVMPLPDAFKETLQ